MSATVSVTKTRNGARLITYDSANNNKTKAHNGYDFDRVLASSGVGCTPENGMREMQKLWKKKQTKQKGMIEAYSIVQSFDPKDFHYQNPEEVQLANDIGNELARKMVPGHLALIYTQADGKNNVVHNHIVICSPKTSNLKAMRGNEVRFQEWAKMNDAILHEHGFDTLAPVNSKTVAKEKITRAEIGAMTTEQRKLKNGEIKTKSATVLRTEQIKQRIEATLSNHHVTNWKSFQKVAERDHNLDVHVRINKKGKVTGLSYRLLDSDMKTGIRGRRLGSNYMQENVNDIFRQNSRDLLREEVERERRRDQQIERADREARQRDSQLIERQDFNQQAVQQRLAPSRYDTRLVESATSTLEILNRQPRQPDEASDFIFDDDQPSIFDEIGRRTKGRYGSDNRDSNGHDTIASEAKRLAEELAEQQKQRDLQRRISAQQIGKFAELAAFYRKRAKKLRKWIRKYYEKSVQFVEEHFASSQHLVSKFKDAISYSSTEFDGSDSELDNGRSISSSINPTFDDGRNRGYDESELTDDDLDGFKTEDAFADASEDEIKRAVGSSSEQPTQPSEPKQKTQPSEPKKRKYLDVDDDN